MATDKDKQIGENVAAFRDDMSQKALADAMRDAGYKWSQSTVWAVEQGTRPLKLAEASVLAKILDTSVDFLLSPTQIRGLLQAGEHTARELKDAEEHLDQAVDDYIEKWARVRNMSREILDESLDDWAESMRDQAALNAVKRMYVNLSQSSKLREIAAKLHEMEERIYGEHQETS